MWKRERKREDGREWEWVGWRGRGSVWGGGGGDRQTDRLREGGREGGGEGERERNI